MCLHRVLDSEFMQNLECKEDKELNQTTKYSGLHVNITGEEQR